MSFRAITICLASAALSVTLALPGRSAHANPDGSRSLHAAQVVVSPAAGAARPMLDRLDLARAIIARARAKEEDCRNLPGWTNVAMLENMVAEIERLRTAGDFAEAYHQALSSRFTLAQERVENEVIGAIPFLVIGPFGNPAWTDPDQPNKPPVIFTAESLTPFIGETDGTNWKTLAPDFAIDPERTYPVFSKRLAQWVPTIKTEYLSFDFIAPQYPQWLVVYAATEINSPETCDAALAVKTTAGSILMAWVNGRLVTTPLPPPDQRPIAQTAAILPYEGKINCQLNAGWNTVLLRLLQRRGMQFQMTVVKWNRQDGQSVSTPMENARYRLPGIKNANGDK